MLFKSFYYLILLSLFLILGIVNVRLYSLKSTDYTDAVGSDVVPQLTWIRAQLNNGSATRMQGFFSEGYYFSNALYGLAWVGVGKRVPPHSDLHKEAIKSAVWALEHLENRAATARFSFNSKPRYGIFCRGWANWLRGGILSLLHEGERDPGMVEKFKADSLEIANAYETSATPFLESYPKQAWPCDNIVAIASLRLHDSLFEPRFSDLISTWIVKVKSHLDPETGLIPHRTESETGRPLSCARGSSQSLIHRFLPEIDSLWAKQQYLLFRSQFLARVWGITGVLEYPPNAVVSETDGAPDSDPFFFGLSLSASAATLAAAQVHGDHELADALLTAGEAVGIPIRTRNEKFYLLGALPISDAFMVWAKTAKPWLSDLSETEFFPVIPRWWRIPCHLLSAGILGVLFLAGLRLFRRRPPVDTLTVLPSSIRPVPLPTPVQPQRPSPKAKSNIPPPLFKRKP